LISQSDELALKAKVVEVSPFLLLLKSDVKFSTAPSDIDFSDFRTLDAVELPGAVNRICEEPLTEKFIQTYHRIRSLRNKISHLGQSGTALNPDELLNILIFHYTELWKNRAWLEDRVIFASQTRDSFFHGLGDLSAYSEVMHELPYIFQSISDSHFRKLFGYSRSRRRYLCNVCIGEANYDNADFDLDECKTSFLDETGTNIHCIVCGGSFKVARIKCTETECKGNVIGDNGDEYAGKCHTCGEYQEF